MSQQQDLLFCKIAITAKKVSQEEAQKCLAIANRFEAEGKRRPQVGEIFRKRNLLTDEDILRIYGAVQKRMEAGTSSFTPLGKGASAGARAGASPGRAPGAPRAQGPQAPARAGRNGQRNGQEARAGNRTARPVKRRQAAGEGIDPGTLWMGIIFGVVALGCIIAMFFLLFFRDGPKPPPPDSTVGIPKASAPATPPANPAPSPPAEKTPTTPPQRAPEPSGSPPAGAGKAGEASSPSGGASPEAK